MCSGHTPTKMEGGNSGLHYISMDFSPFKSSHSSGDESFCSIHLVESQSRFSMFIFWPSAEISLGKLSDSF